MTINQKIKGIELFYKFQIFDSRIFTYLKIAKAN